MSWTSTVPLPATKPSTNVAPSAGRVPGDNAREQTATDIVGLPVAAIVEQTGRPTAHQPVPAGLGGDGEQPWPFLAPCLVVDQGERRLGGADPFGGELCGLVVERLERQAGEDPPDEPVEHGAQRRGIGAAHVAVAQGAGERSQRVHQRSEVGVACRHRRQRRQAGLDGIGKVGQQRHIEHGDQLAR